VTTVAVDRPEPSRTWVDRVLAAVPLASVFIWLCGVYFWEAWRHGSPWLFTDELQTAQLSRSIWETGHAARRGVPYGFETLYTYLIAPVWAIHDTHTAYATVKYIGVLVMTATVFPAYALARQLVSPGASLLVAAVAASIPALAYAPMLLAEPLAYPYATFCFFLIVKALATRRWSWVAGAAAASFLAHFVRGQLSLIMVVYALAALFLVWTGERARRWRSTWSAWDWVGFFVLLIGAIVVFDAVVGHMSTTWLVATSGYKHRMIVYGLWAVGALTIGLGVLPVVAGLASLLRFGPEAREPEVRAFISVTVAALIAFGLYTMVKAAYVSTVFGTLVEERNLIYLSPLLLVGTALWLDRRPRWWVVGLVGAAALAGYVLLTTPYHLDNQFYGDAPGLAILAMSNRDLAFDDNAVKWTLVCVLVISVVLLVVPRFTGRRRTATTAIAAVTGLLVLSWTLAGQISASLASNRAASDLVTNLPTPLDWVDQVTHGQPALYLGHDFRDNNGLWSLEFWNRSIQHVWSADPNAVAPGPGPTLTPDLHRTNGTLSPDPHVHWVVADQGVDLVGKVVRTAQHETSSGPQTWTLYRVDGPLRLAHTQSGITSDGWAIETVGGSRVADASYSQYATPGSRPGTMAVSISRAAWRGPDVPGHVTVRVGKLVIGPDKQPHLGRVTAVRHYVVHSGKGTIMRIPTPKPPIRVEVHVAPTFSPADFGIGDRRELGAQVGFTFVPGSS
jgi:hypothetical protein